MTAASSEVATTVRSSRRPGSAGAGSPCTSSCSRWRWSGSSRSSTRSTRRSGRTPTPRGSATCRWAASYNLDNYVKAFTDGQLPSYFLNTLIVVVPAVFLTLLLASMAAFVLSRFSWRFNLLFLMIFTAGNLLPQQVIITPLFRMYLLLPLPAPLSDNGLWYDQYFGVIAIHIAFQLGFCTFVLSNYMKTLPQEMTEAAVVDGAGVFQIYRKVILPLSDRRFAALVVLETTWIYNDFFWALLLMKSGERMPITSALNSLKGNFFVDNNLIAAGAIIVALPTMIVFFAPRSSSSAA